MFNAQVVLDTDFVIAVAAPLEARYFAGVGDRLDDGVTFVHVVSVSDPDNASWQHLSELEHSATSN
ncbi:MAG: hypothetical protein ABI120_19775 [Gemmatimonadaceae bacterium]